MQTIYTAKHGLQAQQQRLDLIANNIANISTTGYKGQTAEFKDALYTQMINPADVESTQNLRQGSGALLAATHRSFTAGTPVQTGEKLDLSIEGDGFFTVQDDTGNVLYTRGGAFAVSQAAAGGYLVDQNGYYVLDQEGNRIALPNDPEGIMVSADGALSAEGMQPVWLGLVTFTNKDGLSHSGNGCYAQTQASGEAMPSGAQICQGTLESSNVDISQEMSRLIRTQRAYSLAGRVLATWDEMASITNSVL